jgi:hypothetical protein
VCALSSDKRDLETMLWYSLVRGEQKLLRRRCATPATGFHLNHMSSAERFSSCFLLASLSRQRQA